MDALGRGGLWGAIGRIFGGLVNSVILNQTSITTAAILLGLLGSMAAGAVVGIIFRRVTRGAIDHSFTVNCPDTGTVVDSYDVGLRPVGLVSDGANLWVANSGDGTVSQITNVKFGQLVGR
jgi:hypothetical protein